jgi:salicylate hydroxylase
LKKYARQRRGRVAKMRRLARRNGRIYHLTGPMAAARDLFIRALGGKRMLSRQDWIYDWRIS